MKQCVSSLIVWLLLSVAATGQTPKPFKILLTWKWSDPNFPSPPVVTYQIKRAPSACTASPVFVQIASIDNVTQYLDVGVPPGTYCYTVAVIPQGARTSPDAVPAGIIAIDPIAPTITKLEWQVTITGTAQLAKP